MDFLQLVLSRQSDRAYDKERPVEAEKLERILEAGTDSGSCPSVSFCLQCAAVEICGSDRS